MDSNSDSDARFADRAVARLPQATLSPSLAAAIMAGFDAYQARASVWTSLRTGLRRFRDAIWPEAPVWAPVSAIAASLVLGVSLGVVVPAMGNERVRFSLERPTSFSLVTPDLERDL